MNSTQTYQSTATRERPNENRPQDFAGGGQLQPVDDFLEYAIQYARENPGTAALWCFGVGFILGWKLKPW